MFIPFKILIAIASTIFVVALICSVFGLLKKRMYRNRRYLGYNEDKKIRLQSMRSKKLKRVQDEMFESIEEDIVNEEEKTIVLTKELIKSARTANGGLTKKQLAAIGVPWPPPKGWQEKKIGTKISQNQLQQFQTIQYADKKKRKKST